MHAAPDDRDVRLRRTDSAGELQAVTDLRPAHGRDADEQRVADPEAVVVRQPHVEDAHAVAGALERAGDVQQLQRDLRVGRLVPAREDEKHIA